MKTVLVVVALAMASPVFAQEPPWEYSREQWRHARQERLRHEREERHWRWCREHPWTWKCAE